MAQKTAERSNRAAPPARRMPPQRSGHRRSRGLWWGAGALTLVVVGLAIYWGTGRGASGSGTSDGALATLQASDFHALAVSPADPSRVYFGHHNGLMRSDDGGRTWRAFVDRRNFDAMNLAVSRANPNQLYLAGHDIFQVSQDGGASWQPVAHNLPGTDLHGFALSPADANRQFAFVVGPGLFRSADGGQTWQRLGGQLPSDVMALAVGGGNPETLYAAGMRSGVLRSADGGQTWTPAVNGLGSRMVYALAVDPTAPRTVYTGTAGGLYKSTDGGNSWGKLPLPGENVLTLAVSPSQPNVLLAIVAKGQKEGLVYRSEDGGQTWGGRQ